MMLCMHVSYVHVHVGFVKMLVPDKIRIHRKPWYFVTKSFWCRHKDDVRNNDDIPTDTPGGPHIEKIAEHNADLRAVRLVHSFDQADTTVSPVCLLEKAYCWT